MNFKLPGVRVHGDPVQVEGPVVIAAERDTVPELVLAVGCLDGVDVCAFDQP
nr:hypothetical protein [Thiorhodococcus minor]